MKLISLNIWGGHIEEPLLNFIRSYSDIDIFCLQEVYHKAPERISLEDRYVNLNVFSEIQGLLPHHRGYFRPVVNNIYGIGMFIKEDIEVIKEGEINIHHNPSYIGRGPSHSRILQWAECRYHYQSYSIINVHGLWNGQGKADCPERIAQSTKIKKFMDKLEQPKILCGDLNLKPDTDSLQILEKGMTNLIKAHNITSTRTSYYPKPERFADYILISPEIKMQKFAVLNEEVSDHAPLFLDFI